MSPLTDVAILLTSFGAGVIGALAGVGGGILIVPALTVVFGVDLRLAIGASIISVIATSSGAGAAYIRDELTNLRVGMFLEVATTTGAVGGALLAAIVAPQLLYGLFAVILLLSAGQLLVRLNEEPPPPVAGRVERWLRLGASYPDAHLGRRIEYEPRHVPAGFLAMGVAGLVSGLLGIGSGALKVLAMDGVMRLPIKVSSTTSNFMIGVTAAASAGVYIARGDVSAQIAAPVAIGVLAGALVGSRLLVRLSNRSVRLVFLPVLLAVALEMLARALGVGL